MEQPPPIVLECPECGEKYLVSRNSKTPSEKATAYSDGVFIDDLNWRTPLIIGCMTCELGFLPQNGKVVAEPDWEEFDQCISLLDDLKSSTAAQIKKQAHLQNSTLFNLV